MRMLHPRPILRLLPALVLLTGAASGCATQKYRLAYTASPPAPTDRGVVVALISVADGRDDRAIDALLERTAVDEVQTILQQELIATGRVSRVIGASTDGGADILIAAELRQLQWEVPDYKQKTTTAAVVGAVSGGLGALVYGATPTDVRGHARLAVQVKRMNGEELLIREYTAKATERMSKLSSDTHSTKIKMVTQALRQLMADIRSDIASTLRER